MYTAFQRIHKFLSQISLNSKKNEKWKFVWRILEAAQGEGTFIAHRINI